MKGAHEDEVHRKRNVKTGAHVAGKWGAGIRAHGVDIWARMIPA